MGRPSTFIYFDIKVSGEQLQCGPKMANFWRPVPDVFLGTGHTHTHTHTVGKQLAGYESNQNQRESSKREVLTCEDSEQSGFMRLFVIERENEFVTMAG